MNNETLKREAVYKAAALARGDGLSILYRLCDNQKTINTKKVFEHIERTHDFMKECAILLHNISDQLPEEPKKCNCGNCGLCLGL